MSARKRIRDMVSSALVFGVVFGALGCGFALDARAEVGFAYDRELLTARLETSVRSWSIDDNVLDESREVRQLDTRLLTSFQVGENFDMVLQATGGYSDLRTTDVDRIKGPTDTKLKGFVHALDRQLLFSAGISLPTGVTELSDREIESVRAVSPTVLGFRTRTYGQGLGVDLGVAGGTDLRPGLTFGGGLSVLLYGPYDFVAGSEFQPATEFALTSGVDLQRENWLGSVDFVYRLFGTDRIDDEDSFEEGDQFEIVGALSWRGDETGLDLGVRNVFKADNEVILQASPTTDTRVQNGNTFWLSAAPRWNASSILVLKAPINYVAANQSQQQTTSAWSLGFGLAAELQLTDVAILDLRMTKLTGGSEDDELDLSGWDGAASVRWQY